MHRPTGTAITIRLIGPSAAAEVLAANAFDHPAAIRATECFLATTGQPDPRGILVLVWLNGRVVGFASGAVLDQPDRQRTLFVQDLEVAEGARRRGIELALVAALRAEGRARGCMATWVLSDADNAPARATYAAAKGCEAPVVMHRWEEAALADGISGPRRSGPDARPEGLQSPAAKD